MTVVLDASAYLACLNGEPGADAVEQTLPRAVMSTVNFSEVVAKLADKGLSEAEIGEVMSAMPVRELAPFDKEQAVSAGLLRRATRRAGLSLADRACLALAKACSAPALTADRAWAGLDLGVRIEVIR